MSAVSFAVIQSRVSCGGSERRLRVLFGLVLADSFGWSSVMQGFMFFGSHFASCGDAAICADDYKP
jgi:hypothetical protein